MGNMLQCIVNFEMHIICSILINFVKCKCNDGGENCRWTGEHIKCIDKNIKTTGPILILHHPVYITQKIFRKSPRISRMQKV